MNNYLNQSLNASFDAGNSSRRSSSRFIKRKRFDDEIVEYSLGLPPQQLNRATGGVTSRSRTQSTSFNVSGDSQLTPISPMTPMTPIPAPIQAAIPALNLVQQMGANSLLNNDKRRPLKLNKKNKRQRGAPFGTNKDLGRWKPTDDLSLIIGIQQTNDIRSVHRGIKFSCKFTYQELQNRWYSLLYDESISRIAVTAMRNLHPEMVESVQSKALYTKVEEELLCTIRSSDRPTLENFQELLSKNASSFYPARTPKALMNHWQLMKQYTLLPDQTVLPLPTVDTLTCFSDAEDLMWDGSLSAEFKDEGLETELSLADRKNKREIRTIENEIGRWSVLVDSLSGGGIPQEFDHHTLAVLRGRLVRFLMRSREITFGRCAKETVVDVDLSLEGAAYKVSRKHGTIKLRSNGDFFITNEGKRPVFVDGAPLLTGNKTKLNNNNVIEISGIRFIFLINYDLINAIRAESSKTNIPLN